MLQNIVIIKSDSLRETINIKKMTNKQIWLGIQVITRKLGAPGEKCHSTIKQQSFRDPPLNKS